MEDLLGVDEGYWTVEPFIKEVPDLLTGSVADDLMDVYHDLKRGLDYLRAGVPEPDVIWEWRLGSGHIGVNTRSTRCGSSMPSSRRRLHLRLQVDPER